MDNRNASSITTIVILNLLLWITVFSIIYSLFPFPGLGLIVYVVEHIILILIVSVIELYLKIKLKKMYLYVPVFIILTFSILISGVVNFPQDGRPSPDAYISTLRHLKKLYPDKINYTHLFYQDGFADNDVIKIAAMHKYKKQLPDSAAVYLFIDDYLRTDNQYLEFKQMVAHNSIGINILNETNDSIKLVYSGSLVKNKLEFTYGKYLSYTKIKNKGNDITLRITTQKFPESESFLSKIVQLYIIHFLEK